MMTTARIASRMPQLPRQLVTCVCRGFTFVSSRSRPPVFGSSSVMPVADHHVKISAGHNTYRQSTFPALPLSQSKCCHTSGVINDVQLSKAEDPFIKYQNQVMKSNRLHSSLLSLSCNILSSSLSKHCKGISSFPLWMRHFSNAAAPDSLKSSLHGIQKDISSLATKRVVRRKIPNDVVPREQEYYDMVAFATAEEYNLEALRDDIAKQGLYDIVKLPEDAFDALHLEAKYKVNNEPREVFFFREGSVVFWNMQQEEQQTLLSYIRPYQSGAYDALLTTEELEKFEFTYTRNKTMFTGGEIHLRSSTTQEDRFAQQLEMFAFSNALSLSVKLAIWEASLEKYVNSIEWVLQDLKNGKKIRMSEAAVLKKAGELFTLSHLINLSSDLLDTPDFYWDRDNLEKIYNKTCNYLNISRRTRVMNEKLGQCVELTELLRDHLKDKHHTRLELMIIFLILIEVVFQVFHLIEKYYWNVKDEDQEEMKPNTD